MSIITISWGSFSSGVPLAEHVAERLGCRCVSRENLTEAAAKLGIPERKLSDLFERRPGFWERLTESRERYITFIRAAMYDLAQGPPMVYHGQGGQILLREVSHALKVCMIAPLEMRIGALLQQGHPTRESAERYIQKVDEQRQQRIRDLFNVDWRDPGLYDVVVNMGNLSLDSAVDTIVNLAKQPEFQPTPASQKVLNDLTLAARVRVQLAVSTGDGLDFDVQADGGVVWLTGSTDGLDSSYLDQAVTIANGVPGVTEVRFDLEPRPILPYLIQ
ncbi:MAG: cytidylate kinase family protein [Chloroflexota bacterium]